MCSNHASYSENPIFTYSYRPRELQNTHRALVLLSSPDNDRTVLQFSWPTFPHPLKLSSYIRRCAVSAIELAGTNNFILIIVIRIIIELQELTQILVWKSEGRIRPHHSVPRCQSEGVRTGLIAVRARSSHRLSVCHKASVSTKITLRSFLWLAGLVFGEWLVG